MKRTTVILTAGVFALAGCGSPGADAPSEGAGEERDEAAGAVGEEQDEPAAAAEEPVTELEVVGTDELTFEPATFTIPAGEEVTLTMRAEPAVDHDFNVADAAAVGTSSNEDDHDHGGEGHMDGDMGMDDDGMGMDGDGMGMDGGGGDDLHVVHPEADEELTATFTLDEAGTYEVFCSVPGHRTAGMTATLTVVEG